MSVALQTCFDVGSGSRRPFEWCKEHVDGFWKGIGLSLQEMQ